MPAGAFADVIADLAATGSHFLKRAGLPPFHRRAPSQFKGLGSTVCEAATVVWELPTPRQDLVDAPAEGTPGRVS